MTEINNMRKRIFLIVITAIILLLVQANAQNFTQSDVKFCCERTNWNAWCQNAPEQDCSSDYRKTPTNCEATSFCKLGCCYDSQEGICMENTPEKVCSLKNGTWADDKQCDIPQCKYGCCVIGTQAAFVTLTRCKKLSSFYGLMIDFRPNIGDELSCILLASLSDEGACIYELDYGAKTCKFTTRQGCDSMKSGLITGNGTVTGEMGFYKDYLCSNEELGINCGPTQKTACVEGKDEVYFVDSCGNIANIYDANKINDKSYWNKKIRKEDSCNSGNANINNPSCGNCNYFLGSICADYKKSGTKTKYGDYICKDLNCKDTTAGSKKHGESWCSTDKFQDSVGSRYFRHICMNGEEIIEPCADFRQQVCIEDKIGDFSQAGCRVNRWQDCLSQKEKIDCENTDKRDCKWVLGNETEVEDNKNKTNIIACIPEHAPGLKFWEAGEAQGICSVANTQCVVKYEKTGFLWSGDEKAVDNEKCLGEEWKNEQLKKCESLGDCGGKVNFVGKEGNKEGYKIKTKGEEEKED